MLALFLKSAVVVAIRFPRPRPTRTGQSSIRADGRDGTQRTEPLHRSEPGRIAAARPGGARTPRGAARIHRDGAGGAPWRTRGGTVGHGLNGQSLGCAPPGHQDGSASLVR